MKILFVCLGNICRSPLAEGILQKKTKEAGFNWIIDSAGTEAYHAGEAPHRLSQKVALLNGIDISCQRARVFKPSDLDNYDKIYALAGDVLNEIKRIGYGNKNLYKAELLMNELHSGKNEDVPDPYYGGEEGYHYVYEMLNKVCDAIIDKYKQGNAKSEDLISDKQAR